MLTAFSVPTMMLGPAPPVETRRERGVLARAHCEAMGFGMNDWPEDALRVELEDRNREIETWF